MTSLLYAASLSIIALIVEEPFTSFPLKAVTIISLAYLFAIIFALYYSSNPFAP